MTDTLLRNCHALVPDAGGVPTLAQRCDRRIAPASPDQHTFAGQRFLYPPQVMIATRRSIPGHTADPASTGSLRMAERRRLSRPVAAGNTVVLKPSELRPWSARLALYAGE